MRGGVGACVAGGTHRYWAEERVSIILCCEEAHDCAGVAPRYLALPPPPPAAAFGPRNGLDLLFLLHLNQGDYEKEHAEAVVGGFVKEYDEAETSTRKMLKIGRRVSGTR